MPVQELIPGALAGGAFVAACHLGFPQHERRLLGLGLVAAALVYLGLAITQGAAAGWLAAEAGAVALFGLLALAGLRNGLGWLALGWLLHVAWDILLHRGGGAPGYAPTWYPMACVGFDLTVAAWIFSRTRTH